MPWRAQDFVHCQLRWRACRPQLNRDPLGSSTTMHLPDPAPVPLAALVALSVVLPLSAQKPDSNCVHQSELALGPVRLAAYVPDVPETLGRPLREHRSSSEDDGGQYDVLQLQYKGFEVDIGRGHRVERLATTSPGTSLPSGTRVGMTLAETARRLRLHGAPEHLRGDTLAPMICWGDDYGPEAALRLIFRPTSGGERRLAKIELTNHGP